eukprot:TRINITY_DN3358_c0_g1_i1.p1 TRINITY_DN3358_c0_g1~~TRINITY_DN3358_c0_g1_i1.p1  ORF type:complete len:263 (-),score=61.87 TRINITY_DN3358_c0_g1_i1:75-863(-)
MDRPNAPYANKKQEAQVLFARLNAVEKKRQEEEERIERERSEIAANIKRHEERQRMKQLEGHRAPVGWGEPTRIGASRERQGMVFNTMTEKEVRANIDRLMDELENMRQMLGEKELETGVLRDTIANVNELRKAERENAQRARQQLLLPPPAPTTPILTEADVQSLTAQLKLRDDALDHLRKQLSEIEANRAKLAQAEAGLRRREEQCEKVGHQLKNVSAIRPQKEAELMALREELLQVQTSIGQMITAQGAGKRAGGAARQ